MRIDIRHFFSRHHRPTLGLLAGWVLLVGIIPGCATDPNGGTAQPGPITLDVPGLSEPPTLGYDDLAAVLAHAVDKHGVLDTYAPYEDYPRGDRWTGTPNPHRPNELFRRLRRQLQQLAVVGPTSTPTMVANDAQRLAYWWNARTAWAIYIALQANQAGLAPEKSDALQPYRQATFPLDGQRYTLEQIDQVLLALAGPEAVVAAPGISLHRAALPREPFAAATVDDAVRHRLSALLDDPRRMKIDVGAREIRYPPILWTYREAFRQAAPRYGGSATGPLSAALLPRLGAGARRRLQNAVGYAEGPRVDSPGLAYRPAQ